MQYYSSMSLSDYIKANWQELPQELVALFEREEQRYEDQQGLIEHWQENYDCIRDDATHLRKAIEDAVDEYCFGHGDVNTMITEIRDLCEHSDF
jgi:hypothetical protein